MGTQISFAATGDSFITRTLPEKDEKFNSIKNILMSAHVKFTNLETTVHKNSGYPAAVSGGTWAKAAPEVLKVLKDYGFDILSLANNHMLDYSIGGLLSTLKNVRDYNFNSCGAGENLAEACAPNYIEVSNHRVAFIAATSTFEEYNKAGEQRNDENGRPGINPLQCKTTQIITEKDLDKLKRIAEGTRINEEYNLNVREGFTVPPNDDVYLFGGQRFQVGSKRGKVTDINQKDMNRIRDKILEAERRSDYVVVSIHAHQMKQEKNKPAEFIEKFARKCIDTGAHAVIGHGPHVLRGIEIYKKRPIFYSLGNFIYQSETVKNQPHDFYKKYGLGHNDNIADALDAMNDNYNRGLCINPLVFESVVPYWTMKDGKLDSLKLYPIKLGFEEPIYKMGWPRLSKDINILKRIQKLSSCYNTELKIKNNIGIVKLN